MLRNEVLEKRRISQVENVYNLSDREKSEIPSMCASPCLPLPVHRPLSTCSQRELPNGNQDASLPSCSTENALRVRWAEEEGPEESSLSWTPPSPASSRDGGCR